MMLAEAFVVLEVQGGERHIVGEAAGSDPHVVDRAGSAAASGRGGQSAPGRGHGLITGQHGDLGQPRGQFAAAALAPVADLGPPGQLAERDERDQHLAADQPGGQRSGQRSLLQPRAGIRVQDCRIQATWLGQVAVTLGVSESQELLKLLIRLEGVGSQLVQRPHWPGILGRE
jgi:hypothetical protein